MTPFRLALAGLLALALGTGITWLLLDRGGGGGETDVADGGGSGAGGRGADLLDADPARRTDPPAPGMDVTGRAPLGDRLPFGEDLSDPAARARRLLELLGAEAVNWGDVRAIVKLMDEPLSEEARHLLLRSLRMGPHRVQVLGVFEVLRDEAFVPHLVALLDESGPMDKGKQAVLQALARMPGGDDDEVAALIAARLTGTFDEDVWSLQALAQRGGTKATQAFLDYLARGDPRSFRANAFLPYDVATTPEALALLGKALEAAQGPAHQQALLALAARPGADGLTATLIAMDTPEADPDTRLRALRSLAVIGGEQAVKHLLTTAQGTGQLATQALDALRGLRAAPPAVRAMLRQELERAGLSGQPSRTKQRLAETLGLLKDEAALPQMVGLLDDPDPAVGTTAIVAIGRLGSAAAGHVPALAEHFDGGEDQVRGAVVNALANIGGQAAFDQLVTWTKRTDLPDGLARAIQTALVRIGQRMKRAGG